MNKREQFHKAVMQITDELNSLGVDLPPMLKRRDRREPGREEKEHIEDRITMLFRRYFKRQKEKLLLYLTTRFADRKDIIEPIDPIDDLLDGAADDEFIADLIKLIAQAGVGGVNLFKQAVTIGIDYDLINDKALDWARSYSYDKIKEIQITTRDKVSRVISRFIETPGFTIGDISDQLINTFGVDRARMIAVTETTRAYAEGQLIAGKEMQKEFPDVRVTKEWFTNVDDRVCEICEPLDGKVVDINEDFDGGISEPPAHVNCRCWIQTRTRI